MRRFPYPFLALFIFVMWLMLMGRVTPGQILLGAAVGCLSSWGMSLLKLERPKPRRPLTMVRLFFFVIADIIRSNVAVILIITKRDYRKTSNFLVIPLTMTNETGLAILAGIISATPGTLWISHDRATNELLLHILDLVDEEGWIDTIKGRYERLLIEIFE